MNNSMYINLHTHNECAGIAIRSLFHDQDIPSAGLCSVGIHPWHSGSGDMVEALTHLEKALSLENVVAVGEIGLDRAIELDFALQLELFRKQLALAEKYQMPVIIHCVRAYPEVIAELKKSSVPVIVHGFRGNKQIADQLVKHGVYLSFGSALIESPPVKLVEALKATPKSQLFFETDESECDIEHVYNAAAKLLGFSMDDLASGVLDNFHRVFPSISLKD